MSTTIFRPDRKVYIIFGVILSLPVLVALITGIFTSTLDKLPGLFEPFAILVLIYLSLCLYFHSHEIRIENEQIVFKSLFGGKRAMPLSGVEKVRITAFEYDNPSERCGPPIRLRVYPRKELGLKPMAINAKLFKAEDLRYIRELFKT